MWKIQSTCFCRVVKMFSLNFFLDHFFLIYIFGFLFLKSGKIFPVELTKYYSYSPGKRLHYILWRRIRLALLRFFLYRSLFLPDWALLYLPYSIWHTGTSLENFDLYRFLFAAGTSLLFIKIKWLKHILNLLVFGVSSVTLWQMYLSIFHTHGTVLWGVSNLLVFLIFLNQHYTWRIGDITPDGPVMMNVFETQGRGRGFCLLGLPSKSPRPALPSRTPTAMKLPVAQAGGLLSSGLHLLILGLFAL